MSGRTRAVVLLPALDLRPAPDHRAELGSQLLMGETVRLLSRAERRGWWRVRSEIDGYEGWVRGWGLVVATPERARRWLRLATGRIVEAFVAVTASAGGGLAVSPLFLGSRVIPGRLTRGRREVELPDGRRGWVVAAAVRGSREPAPALVARVTSLLGAPYLWGGRTPAGLDCSAFTQLVLAEQGISLPRDAHDQHAACLPVPGLAGGLEGDLACFAVRGGLVSHVGLALGEGYFAHCRGRVRIASLNRANKLWDNEIGHQFVGWFRPRERAVVTAPRAPGGRFGA